MITKKYYKFSKDKERKNILENSQQTKLHSPRYFLEI